MTVTGKRISGIFEVRFLESAAVCFLFKVSAQANFAHFCIIFSGCFMDNIYMSLH